VLDDYQCYKSRTTKNTPKFNLISGVTVVDRFTLIGSPTGYLTFDARKMESHCNPADVNGGGIVDPTEHEVGYQVRITRNAVPYTPFFKVLNQQVVNDEFGTLTLDILKPARVLLTSAKSLVAPPPPLVAPVTDDFSCYKVRTSRFTPKFVAVPGVTITDQFGSKTMTVKKPALLCAPADVNGGDPGAHTHAGMLLCYKLQRPKTTPKFTTVSPVYINNTFGPLSLDAQKNDLLCVKTQAMP
jgi:hypothetical protein